MFAKNWTESGGVQNNNHRTTVKKIIRRNTLTL